MIQRLLDDQSLKPSGLKAVSVSIGPGSYTGLRVGLSTSKAICYASGSALVAVDTLESLAWAARQMTGGSQSLYVAVSDARRQDAYMGVFNYQGERVSEDQFLTVTPDCLDWLGQGSDIVICGEGLEKWVGFEGREGFQLFPVRCSAVHLVPVAVHKLRQGRITDLATIVPNYLKPPNITVPR